MRRHLFSLKTILVLFCCVLQALVKYIKTLKIDGAILIFLPGWNLIFALHKHLEMHPEFGKL